MMLLAAVVLVIAFLSLTTLVSRTGSLRAETLRPQPAIFDEAETVERGVKAAINATTSETELANSLSHLARIERANGVVMTWVISCPDSVSVKLQDGRSAARFDVGWGGATVCT